MMKKVLLGTTAIIGASVVLASAAQAEKPKISMSGNMKFEAYAVDQDAQTLNRGYHFEVDDAEIVFKASATADNGLEYGAKIEYEFENSSTDEAVIWLSGDWGLVNLGNEDGAEDLVKVGGWSVLGATGGWDGENFFDHKNALVEPKLAGDTSDATKVTYFTPSFNGFRAGISWTPDSGHEYDAAYSDTSGSATETPDFQNALGIGVEYKGTFSEVGLHVSGRYANADYEGTGAATDPDYENISAFALGAKVDYAGFSLGVGYANNGDAGTAKGSGKDFGDWYDVAVGYATGPYAVAVGYYHSEKDLGSNTDVESDQIAVTGDYTVADGLAVYAEYDYVDIDEDHSTSNDNEANVFMVGTKVSF